MIELFKALEEDFDDEMWDEDEGEEETLLKTETKAQAETQEGLLMAVLPRAKSAWQRAMKNGDHRKASELMELMIDVLE